MWAAPISSDDTALMLALLTRPLEDSRRIADLLKKRGIESCIDPLMEILYYDAEPDLNGIEGLLFTSANGVRAFCRLEGDRSVPVYAIGNQTARLCQEMGFQKIENASGDVASLIQLVKSKCPAKSSLFHAAGAVHTGNLSQELSGLGFKVRRQILYEAKEAVAFSNDTIAYLRKDAFDFLLLFSPRSARIFNRLAREIGIFSLPRSRILCLSQAVARETEGLRFKEIAIAQNPDLPSLLTLVDSTPHHG